MTNWLEWAEEEAQKRGEEARRLDEDPEYQKRIKAKKDEEFKRGVRLGWWDESGEPIDQPEDDESDDDAS